MGAGSDSESGTAGIGEPTVPDEVPTRALGESELDNVGRELRVPAIEVGQQLGRYVVLRELGSGGMSVVYAAFDPQLDRRVAVKLMRPGGNSPAGESTQRLQREAQALARLSHPNVVHVYDVGTVGSHVYIAMEMVEGQTLRTWLKGRERPWHDVVDVLQRAGRGLAAAHDVGLVHLDFKPSNVLLGDDGRVRVVDFGLAREPRRSAAADLEDSRGPESKSRESYDSGPRSTTRLADPLTEYGAVMGTPGYIAPEQLMGLEADARSDQFAFCVTLWEALYGRRPFRGANRRELERAILRGKIKDPSEPRGVPPWLHKAVLRGLQRDPDQRYPNLEALLKVLGRDPVRRRRQLYLVAGSVAVAGIGFAVHDNLVDRERVRCHDAAASLEEAWNPERSERVADAFMASGLPYAADAWTKVSPIVDAYVLKWGEGRVDACEATHVRGDQSAELLDARILCLDRARHDLEAALDLLEAADAKTVENSLETVDGLPNVEVCSDPGRVRNEMQLPDDPVLREQVAALEAEFARISALRRSGHYAEALEIVPGVLERARATGDPGTITRNALEMANVYTQMGLAADAESILEEALWLSESAGLDEHRGAILAEYVYLVGNLQGNFRRAEWFAQAAHAALDRVGGDMEQRGDLLTNESVLAAMAGDAERAISISKRVLELRREFGFGTTDTHASILGNMGSAYFNAGDYEHALENYQSAYQMRLDVFGPRHPIIAISLENLGNALTGLGRFDQALERHREAYELTLRAKIPEGIRFAILLNNIAVSLHGMERLDEAAEYWGRSADVWGRHDPEHAAYGVVLCNLGEIDRARGDHELGVERYGRARTILEAAVGSEHAYFAVALGGLGRALADLGQYATAVPHLERAREIHQNHPFDELYPAETDFHLARSLWAEGDPAARQRAETLARGAHERLEAVGPRGERTRREIEDWLDANATATPSG